MHDQKNGLQKLVFFLVVVAIAALPACAYRMGSGDREIPGGYNSVAVPVFKNVTPETGVEVYFTNAMIRELERSRISRVAKKSEAQVTLEGTVSAIRYGAVTQITESGSGTGSTGLPADTVLNAQYRILVDVKLVLIRNSDQKTLWQGAFTRERTYLTPRIGTVGPDGSKIESLTSANALYNHSARYQNIQAMAVDLMAEAHDRLTEKF